IDLKIIQTFPQIILYGPPGTGKTYLAKEMAKNMSPKNWKILQFHPSYNYEDFVRGIESTTTRQGQIKYKFVNRILAEMAEKASKNQDKKYILIIDEINRANLASVLGELIYALEYRGEPVHSMYEVNGSGEITIPENLYIIGTMNTADRSIGHIDYAVRRRFAFHPVLPDKNQIEQYYNNNNNNNKKKNNLKDCATWLFERVEALFKNNLASDFHPDDVQVGHTYFFAETEDELLNKFIYQIYPLLREYYKDGILIKSNDALEIPETGVTIAPLMRPDEIRKTLNCSKSLTNRKVGSGNEDTNESAGEDEVE
ncbi:MAG: AAA family ATPase, partial [Nitrospirae bacterium]